MKNKKLFAILTLVCFMFTLMPVAAFAADPTYAGVDADSATIDKGNSVTLNITRNGYTGNFYYFAEKNGVPYVAWDIQGTATTADNKIVTLPINDAGEYTIYVVDKNDYTEAAITDKVKNGLPATIATLKANSRVAMLEQNVTVSGGTDNYAISFYDKDMKAITSAIAPAADAGFSDMVVYVKLTNGNSAVVGQELDITTNTSGVSITQARETTNADGTIKLTISAALAGNFKIYAEYGNVEKVLDVTATPLTASNVTTVGEPTAPIALKSDVNSSDVYFSFVDANNNATGPVVGTDTKIVVVEKPAGSTITDAKMMAAGLVATDNGYTFGKNKVSFDKEGTYTFKVVLSNGNYATATVDVKEFIKPVELQLVYPTNAVELAGKISPKAVRFVDVNGTVDNCTIGSDVVLSARGYAIADFAAGTGAVEVKSDESYVGSVITVLAVSERYGLTDTVELVVAKEAAGVKYVNTNADVAVNNTLVANIVDEDGNKVALNDSVKAQQVTVQYVVLEKPENAKVAVSTKGTLDKLASQGQFKVSFTASEIGTYKLQTVVRYEQAGVTNNNADPVVKYYSGIEDITVGNTGIEDVVVMSVGSNEIVKNGKVAVIDAAPIVENNRTFVPFRALAEAFGATVAFDEATQAVTAELNGTTVVMTIGSAEYTVNGVAKTADVAPFINGSRTMVPVRFVAQAFGITVTPTYDDNGATADILFAK